MDYSSLPLPGAPFEHFETYVYYDGPQAFALRSTVEPDLYAIVNTVEDDDTTIKAIAVIVDAAQLHDARSGLIPFRHIFTNAVPKSVYLVTWSFPPAGPPQAALVPFRAGEIPEAWLPADTARLKLEWCLAALSIRPGAHESIDQPV